MLKLYGQYRSRTFRVAWLLKESNIPYEHVNISIHTPDATAKTPEYLKLNPCGRIPTIDDDGFVMWESAAINLYLAEKHKSPLWPTDMRAKGRMLQWAFFTANDIEPYMVTVMQNRMVFPPEKRNPALAEEADRKLQPGLKVLDDHLANTRYFGAGRWDMADFMVASVCFSFSAMKYDLSQYPRFERWLTESLARPAAREAIALRQ